MNKLPTARICDIVTDESTSWKDKVFLTFDIDWAHDEIISDTIDIVEAAGVSATWFVTHETPILERLRANPDFELGIHPNFNNLLNGNHNNGRTVEEIVDRLLELVPEAKSVRSHSMTQNSRLLQLFADKGLMFDCNHFIPIQSGMPLKPWALWNELVKVPHLWEDDAAFIYKDEISMPDILKFEGLKVFDFHPIHVFLNTMDSEHYESTRELHYQPSTLKQHRSKDPFGARSMLNALLSAAQ